MKILILINGRSAGDFEAEMSFTELGLLNKNSLSGGFVGFDKFHQKWWSLHSAAGHGEATAIVEGRRYKLTEVRGDGAFTIIPFV